MTSGIGIDERRHRTTLRRRASSAVALVGTSTVLAGVAAVMATDPLAGLLGVCALAATAWLVWQGVLRRDRQRAAFLSLATLALAVVLGLLAARALVVPSLLIGLGTAVAAAAIGTAFRPSGPGGPGWVATATPVRPVLFINPRSGGGKAERVGLLHEAGLRGVDTVVVDAGDDLAALARQAVTGGADALGMAGGDGSQAVVAAVAADHDVPFVCVPAGTRNHFALDLGVDRDDVVGALDAFTDGVQRRIDLAEVNGHIFVNNVSLGVYGVAVQREEYRASKVRTLLDTVPDVLGPSAAAPPLWVVDDQGHQRDGAALLLVSNNPYALDRAYGRGSRPALDGGQLGIVVLGPGSRPDAWRWSATTFDVASVEPVPAAADGEALTLTSPLHFATRPQALLVRIARHHPGVSPSAIAPTGPASMVRRLVQIALGR